jgi:hypothetical protein
MGLGFISENNKVIREIHNFNWLYGNEVTCFLEGEFVLLICVPTTREMAYFNDRGYNHVLGSKLHISAPLQLPRGWCMPAKLEIVNSFAKKAAIYCCVFSLHLFARLRQRSVQAGIERKSAGDAPSCRKHVHAPAGQKHCLQLLTRPGGAQKKYMDNC